MAKALFQEVTDIDDLEVVWEPASGTPSTTPPYSGIVMRPARERDEIPVDEDDGELPRLYDAIPTDEGTGATRFSEFARQLGRVSTLSSVPRVVWHDVAGLPLDARSAFMFSRIDGESTLETLLDVCAMSESEAMEALLQLVELGVVAFE